MMASVGLMLLGSSRSSDPISYGATRTAPCISLCLSDSSFAPCARDIALLAHLIVLKRVGYLSTSTLLLFGAVGGAGVQLLFFTVYFGYRNLEFESWKFISHWIILGIALA